LLTRQTRIQNSSSSMPISPVKQPIASLPPRFKRKGFPGLDFDLESEAQSNAVKPRLLGGIGDMGQPLLLGRFELSRSLISTTLCPFCGSRY